MSFALNIRNRLAPTLFPALFMMQFWGSAVARETDWREKIVELQRIEQLMSAAIKVRDRDEMDRQMEAIRVLVDWMKVHPGRNEHVECGRAMFDLFYYGSSLRRGNTAQDYLNRQDSLVRFQTAMKACESRLDLPATQKPNLRSEP